MYPFLFSVDVFGHHVRAPTYGVLLALAFSLAYFYSLRQAQRLGDDPRDVEAFFLTAVFSSVLGSRLFHVVFEEPGYYMANPGKILAVWEGGYTLYGAMLATMLGMYLVSKFRKVPFLEFVDIAAPATALGIAVGRVGCFFAGCCWGSKCDLPWAVTFTHPESFTSARNVPLHPSQLYEAFGATLVFLYLNWRIRHRSYRGQSFFEGLAAYSILRFLIEYFRGDEYRGYVLGGALSYSQLVSVLILPFAVVAMFLFSRKPLADETPRGR